MRQLLAHLRTQARVIRALLMREVLTRFGRHNIGFLWLFVEPMIFTLGVTALWTAARLNHGSSLPISAFAITGYSSVLLWRNMPNRCSSSVGVNLALMYHRNVRVLDIFASRLIVEATGASISFVILANVFTFLGLMDPPEDLLKVMMGWGMLAWFGSALAILIGALSERSEIVEKLWHPATYLLFPLSGAAFNVDALPPAAQHFVLALPMVHGVEMLREGYFGSAFRAHYDMGYMAACCSILTLLGLMQAAVVGRQVTPE